MTGPGLLDAVLATSHDHSRLKHPQTGNPFYPWWDAARFGCDLCLAVMRDSGEDISLAFGQALPYRLEYDFDRRWWRTAYLNALRFVPDPFDREWMRQQLAEATRRGRAVARVTAPLTTPVPTAQATS